MRRLAIIVGLGAALAVPSTALGWTYEECVEVDFNHPDCEQYTPPPEEETPPVEVPPVVPPVTPPAETVVPEVTPPVPPVPPLIPPPVEVPSVEETAAEEQVEEEWTPVPDAPPVKPKSGIGSAAYAESQQAEVSAAEVRDTLPLTGWQTGLVGLLGLSLTAVGVVLRRRFQ